jgi:hypothetical protein
LVRPGTIAGDGTIAGGIKFGSIHPYGVRLRRIGAHRFVRALGHPGSGARIALAAIAPTGQTCDHPAEVVPNDRAQVGPNVPVRVVPVDPNGPVRDVPNGRKQDVPNGPAGDVRSDQQRVVPSDLQPVRNGHAMHGRTGQRLVRSGLIGQRHRDRRPGGKIARPTGSNGKSAHSNAHVLNSEQGSGRRLRPHAAVVVRNNGAARRERGLKGEGIEGNAERG